jgi:hypothetical protein
LFGIITHAAAIARSTGNDLQQGTRVTHALLQSVVDLTSQVQRGSV